jgi:glycosyltransferase involved in cell wall biosynthesis
VQLENKKVSVIIPFFNRIHLLKRAIESVQSQTYKNWELILVDDCGSEKCDLHTDEFIVIRNEKNSGPGFSRQAGLEIAQGEFVAFLDSDDYYAPSFIEKSLEKHIERGLEIAFTYCWSGIAEDPKQTWNKTDEAYLKIFPNLVYGRQWPTGALLWNRKYLKDWNPFYMWEDYDVEFRSALFQNSIGYVSEKLAFISRGDSGGLSQQNISLAKLKDQLKVFEFLWEHKLEFEELLDNRLDSKIVWTQITIRTLKNVRCQLEIDSHFECINQLGVLKKVAGIEFGFVLRFSSFFLRISKKFGLLWLKIFTHFYSNHLRYLKGSSLKGQKVISHIG